MSRNYLNRDISANIVIVPAKEGNNKVNSFVTSQITTIQSTNMNYGPRNSSAQDFNQYHGPYVRELDCQSFYYNNFNVAHLGTPQLHSHLSESQSNTYYWNSNYNNVTNIPDVPLQNTAPNVSNNNTITTQYNNTWYPGGATDVNNYINNTYYPVQNEYYKYVTPCYSECCQPNQNIQQDAPAPTANQHGLVTSVPIHESVPQINSQHTHYLQQNYNNTHETPPKISVRKDPVPLNLNVKENKAQAEINLPKSSKYETSVQPPRKINSETKIKEKNIYENPIKLTLKKNVIGTEIQNFLDSIKLTSPKKLPDNKMKIYIEQPSSIDRNRSEKVFNSSVKKDKAKKRVLDSLESEVDYHSERKKYKETCKTYNQDTHLKENRENMTKIKEHISEKDIKIKNNQNKLKYKSDRITATKDTKYKDNSSRSESNKKLNENNIVKLIEKNKVETVQKTNRRQELLREIKRLEEKLKQAREANIKLPVKEKNDNENKHQKHSYTKEITNNSDAKSKKEKCKLKSVVKVSNVFNMGSKDKKKDCVQHKNKYYIIKNDDTTIINTSKYYEPSLNSNKSLHEKRVKEKYSTGVKLKYNTKFEKFHKRDQLTITVSTRNDESDEESTKSRNVKLIDKLKKTKKDQNVKAYEKTQTIKTKNQIKSAKQTEVETHETIEPIDLDTSFLDDINVDEIVESLNFLNDELKNYESKNIDTFLKSTPLNEISKSIKIHTNPDHENIINKNNEINISSKFSHVDKISENNNSLKIKPFESEYDSSSIITSSVNIHPDLPLDLTTSTKSFDIKNYKPAPKSVEEIELELKQFFESSESEDDEVKNANTIDLSSKFILSKNVVNNFSKPDTLSLVQFPDISETKGLSDTSKNNVNSNSQCTKTERNYSEQNYGIENKFLSELSAYKDIMKFSNYTQETKPIIITNENDAPPIVVEKTTSEIKVIDLSCNKTDDCRTLVFGDSEDELKVNNNAHELKNEVTSPMTEKHRVLEKDKDDSETPAFGNSEDELQFNANAHELTNEVALPMTEKHRKLEKDKDDSKTPAFGDSEDELQLNNNAHESSNEVVSPMTKEHREVKKDNNSVNNYINNQNDIFDDSIATYKLVDLLEQDDLEILEEGLEIPKNVVNKLNSLKQNCDEASNISPPIINSAETEYKNTNILDLTTFTEQEEDTFNTEPDKITVDEESTTIATDTIKSDLISAKNTIIRSNTESLPIEDNVRDRIELRISSYLKSTCSIKKFIHQGKFSKIYSIRKHCGEVVVAKIFRYNYDWKEKIAKEKKLFAMQEDIPKEKYNCVWFYDGLGIDDSWCYLMEYFPKNLNQALVENKKPFSIELIQRLAKQLVTAVFIVRNNSIVHTDISPRHILLSASNETLKLCGFDESHPIDHSDITPMIGSARYRAPEVILGHSAGPSIDVWATALVLYKMATKIDMFAATTNNRLLYQQMLKFGMVPKQMLAASKFRSAHFNKNKFIKKSITKGDLGIEKHFQYYDEIKPNKKWQILMHKYYFKLYPKIPSSEALLRRFIVILSKMLVIDVNARLSIEFVCIDKFIH